MKPYVMTAEQHGDGSVCAEIATAIRHNGELKHSHNATTGEVTIFVDDRADTAVIDQVVASHIPPVKPQDVTYYTTEELDDLADAMLDVFDVRAHLKLLHTGLRIVK